MTLIATRVATYPASCCNPTIDGDGDDNNDGGRSAHTFREGEIACYPVWPFGWLCGTFEAVCLHQRHAQRGQISSIHNTSVAKRYHAGRFAKVDHREAEILASKVGNLIVSKKSIIFKTEGGEDLSFLFK